MKPEDFLQYLEQPRLLYQLPLTDLQELALAYPYSPNLRLLLLLKTHLDGHPEENEYLNRCASAAFDRSFIYDLLRDPILKQSATEDELDTLELMTLDDIALETPPLEAISAADQEAAATIDYSNLFAPPLEEEIAPALPPTFTEDAPAAAPALPFLFGFTDTADAYLASLPIWPSNTTEVPNPEPISKFESKTTSTPQSTLQNRLRDIRRLQAGKLADAQEEVRKIARRSLVAQEAVASETLAKLLVQQGQYKNALKMYQRLSLLYPEKKTIFAGLIKDLKEKL